MFRYLGHSAFFVDLDGTKLLIDPWITGNPSTKYDLREIMGWGIDYILVTHGHADHGLEDAIKISKETGAPVVGTFELVNVAMGQGAKGIPANTGGTLSLGNLEVYLAPAFHTCPYGAPIGYVIKGSQTIYHAGDTSLTYEFKVLSQLFNIDWALLPIGGTFTMSYKELPLAKEYLNAKNYFPMHYNTFPAIRVDLEEVKKYVPVYEVGTEL